MSDPVNALGGAWFEGLVRVDELPPQGMITLRGDLTSETLRDAVTKLTGADFPDMRQASCDGDKGILWMSPDELLLLCPHTQTTGVVTHLQDVLKGSHALVADVSDARAVFRLKGALIRETLAKLAPVDLAPDSFAPGELRRTRLAQAAAAFWLRDETTADLICFRSVAQYVFDLLSTASAEGSEVRYFPTG